MLSSSGFLMTVEKKRRPLFKGMGGSLGVEGDGTKGPDCLFEIQTVQRSVKKVAEK